MAVMPSDGRGWLIVGTVAGLALAGFGALRGPPALTVPEADAIAMVNGIAIPGLEQARAVEALAADKRNPLTADDEAAALDRLIEEELLVQRGEAMGLLRSDRALRQALVQAVVAGVIAESASQPVDEDALAAFYAEQKGLFTRGRRYRIAHVLVRNEPGAIDDAMAALAQGTDMAAVARDHGVPGAVSVPDTPLTVIKLRDYIGAAAAEAVANLAVDQTTPVATPGGWHIVRLLEAAPGETPALNDIRGEAVVAYKRHRDDLALRSYLDRLRAEASVHLAPDAPQ